MTEQRPFRKFRRFVLQRHEDLSGSSGTGIVAEGTQYSNGKTVLSWTSRGIRSVGVYDSVHEMEALHGHEGRTVVVWIDT